MHIYLYTYKNVCFHIVYYRKIYYQTLTVDLFMK